MKQRINVFKNGYKAVKPLFGLGAHLAKSPLKQTLLHLVDLRVSQINGCAYCLDMHSKDLRAAGETEQRLHTLGGWREAPFYSEQERGALAWAEAVTNITDGHVPEKVYEEASKHFSEEEFIDLTLAVVAVNCFNRINIAFRTPAGTYEVGQHTALKT